MDEEYLIEHEVGDYVTYPDDDAYEPDDDDVEDDIGREVGELEDDADNLENAISQMQGDFDRIVKCKVQASGPTKGPITGKWTFEFEEDDAMDFQRELRETSGIGRRKKARRSRNVPELSPQVKDLISKGIEAYTNSNIEEAIPLLREAIRIEPRAVDAWTTLAECHLDLGQEVECLQLRIIATHLREPDVETWRELGQKSKEIGYLQQALYCFRKILYIDPQDLDALWDRSYLYKMQGDHKKALEGFLRILKSQHYDPNVLEEVRLLLIELDDAPKAAKLFQQAFDFYSKHQPEGPESENDFGARQIIALTDFYNNVNEYEKAISTIRRGARWLDSRFHEGRSWDSVQDDREFDLPGYARDEGDGQGPAPGYHPLDINFRQRLAISRLRIGDIGEAQMHASIVLSTEHVVEYSILFEELANVYFDLAMYEDAREIYIKLATRNETNSIFIILRIGACDRNLCNYQDAIESYQWALKVDPSLTDAKSRLAEVFEITGRLQEALDLIHEVLDIRHEVPITQVVVEDESTEETAPHESQPIGSFFDETRKPTASTSVAERKKISKDQLRAYEQVRQEQILATFEKLDRTEEDMLAGNANAIHAWLSDCGDLVEEFRITRQLFTADRTSPYRGIIIDRRQNRDRAKNKSDGGDNEMASRLQLEIAQDAAAAGRQPRGVDNFRGVTFTRWLSMIAQYCFLLTREDQYPLADEVLRHMLLSNAYNNFKNQNTIRLVAAICAIRSRHYQNVIEHCQRLFKDHQFNNDPFRFLLAALSNGGLDANEAFIATNFQKVALRELRLWEANARGDPLVLRQNGARWIAVQGDDALDDDENPGTEAGTSMRKAKKAAEPKTAKSFAPQEYSPTPVRPKKMSPLVYACYGYVMLCARSYQSAKWYLLQAHALQPRDPVICLSLAITCIGRAMQRQADNRHHLIVEAVAFLNDYRKYRRSDQGLDEVEYNFGRAFQQLGLYSLSVSHYQRALNIVSEQMKQNPHMDRGLAQEAAYNLSLIYVTNGSPGLAKSLYKNWLSI